MLTQQLPIIKETKKLRNIVLRLTGEYPKRFKYTIGERMMNITLDLNQLIRRANEETVTQNRAYYLRELRYKVEDLEDLVDASFEFKVISIKQMSEIASVLDVIGKQTTGWLKSAR